MKVHVEHLGGTTLRWSFVARNVKSRVHTEKDPGKIIAALRDRQKLRRIATSEGTMWIHPDSLGLDIFDSYVHIKFTETDRNHVIDVLHANCHTVPL